MSPSNGIQGLAQVADDVVDIFRSDGQADEVGRDSRGSLLFGSELLVSRARRVDDQRFAVANIGQVREQLHVIDQLDSVVLLCVRILAVDTDADDVSAGVRQ